MFYNQSLRPNHVFHNTNRNYIFGNSIGVRNGGRLALNMRKMFVEGLPANLPEKISIDITQLTIGSSIRVSDMSIENLTFLNNSDDVIVAVKTARAAIAQEEEEDPTQETDASSSEEGASEKAAAAE